MHLKHLFYTLLFLSNLAFGQNKLDIVPLQGDYYIFTTYNFFGDKLFPANGMYCVTNQGVVMIDTPWDTTQFQPLLDTIKQRHHQKVVLCIATHYHDDRTGGFDFLRKQGVKTFSSAQTLQLCKEKEGKQAEFTFSKDTIFQVGYHSFETFYAGEGHTKDNLVIWCKKEQILYGGCLVKSIDADGLGNLADANVTAWTPTIKRVQKRFKKAKIIIPGHYNWSNKNALKHTLRLLKDFQSKK
jgi:glyoxylase-like metal-dependent hydrolase (beta-lactamase superfamily II)